MVAETKASVKTRFETGDIPTQTDFGILIDSYQDFSDPLTAITSAVVDRGRVGFLEVIGTANVTANAAGNFGRTFVGAGTTAAGVAFLNAMTTDTTQTISGAKTFTNAFRVAAVVTVVNTATDGALLLVGTDDHVAGSTNAPLIRIQREYSAGQWADGDQTGGIRWNVQPSATSTLYTLANHYMSVNKALTSATDARIIWATRVGSDLVSQLSIGGSAGGVSLVSAAGGTISPLGTGTLNADRLYSHNGRQITPHQQAFAWAQIRGASTPASAGNHAINVASVTDNGTGDYTIVFSTAASDVLYGININPLVSATTSPPTAPIWAYIIHATAGGCRVGTLRGTVGASAVDTDRVNVTIWDGVPNAGERVH